MARLTGPLMSLAASGSLANTLTFGATKGRNFAKRYSKPANPNTTPQFVQRLAVKAITQAWQELTADEQAAWQPLADQLTLSPYHAYLRFNLHRWRQDYMCSITPDPATEITTPFWHWGWSVPNPHDLWFSCHVYKPTPEPFMIQLAAKTEYGWTVYRPHTIHFDTGTEDVVDYYQIEDTIPLTNPLWITFRLRFVDRAGATSSWKSPI